MTVSVDPVRGLLRDHRALCERAVDPLEIAAGLEARGLTDRAAARFRHRDLFSLAEELYARAAAPAEADGPRRPRPRAADPGAGLRRVVRALLPLLPGALCAAGLRAGADRTVLAAATLAAVWLVLFRRTPVGPAGLLALPPLAHALGGDPFLDELLPGPQEVTSDAAATALALSFAVAPAAWSAAWFAARCRRRLAASRGVRGFAAGARPLLAAALGLYLAGLLAAQGVVRLLLGPSALGSTTALGLLLGIAVLLIGHGFRCAAAAGLAVAGGVEALAVALASASWLPGCGALGRPVASLVAAHGLTAVPVLACACAAAGLLVLAARSLTGPAAHHETASPTVLPNNC
ncbi:hypothetical protein [Streptomyces litchfieldiae]|uniref:Integral membrane protein n=1 Tax=Streptomyces litchfieldiae TaxID=3075543 RepID=A0ABU2MM39_9ACTN|nr:hypothetical protein [Streptomyces sp. DSM 44938]MDT0342541.1 hypothetical protein [Streptomyces sp. DSM 44938]